MSEPAADPRPDTAPPRGQELLRAVAVMEALRAPDGDAWTHTQTHASLARYLLEETHEVLEVIEDPAAHGPGALADELGDLLFQILFHARLGEEEDPPWDVDTVARSFVAKMERRNPHVFGPERDAALADPGDVEEIIAQWHAVKAAEKAERAAAAAAAAGAASAADPSTAPAPTSGADDTADAPGAAEREPSDPWSAGIPARLPALQRAAKMVHRARSAGQLNQLLAAADRAAAPAGPAAASTGPATRAGSAEPSPGSEPPATAEAVVPDALGRALLDLVVAAEAQDVDPESALRSLLTRLGSAAPR